MLQVINCEQNVIKRWELTQEGNSVADAGSHEALIFNAVPSGGIPQAELMVSHANMLVLLVESTVVDLSFTKMF